MMIREEEAQDVAAIRSVVEAAFGRPDEANLVDQLRTNADSVISLIALDDGCTVGHVLFSKMEAPFPALGLAPVSVLPDRQREGIGSRLIREGLAMAEKAGKACSSWATPPTTGASALIRIARPALARPTPGLISWF